MAISIIFTACEVDNDVVIDKNTDESSSKSFSSARIASQNEANSKVMGPRYVVKASDARVIRKVLGEITNDVHGVPAEPVHSFTWDGTGVSYVNGKAKLEIDPVNNTGEIKASWKDDNGVWNYNQEMFAAPPHPSGLHVGPDALSAILIQGDPVTTNVYLHGNSTAGEPVLPTLFNYLATWGPAEVTLNGEPFINPFDGPAPNWAGHTMTSVGVRQDDGTVRTVDGNIFNPFNATDNGVTDGEDLEYHIVFHDVPGPVPTNNFPPTLSFFYHIMFEDVKIEIK